jgi:predicted CoA-binding protein
MDLSRPAGERHRNDPEVIRRLLTDGSRRWAVVGLSGNASRVAYGVAAFVQNGLGKQIVPVHPRVEPAHGETGYPSLAAVPGRIDVVDVFVNSALAGGIVDEAIAVGAGAVWLQLGVIDEAAAARAAAAGLDVVMDVCPAIEAPRMGIA